MAKATWLITVLLCCWLVPAHAALPVPDDRVDLRQSGELYFLFDAAPTLDQLRTPAIPWQLATAKTQLTYASATPLWMHVTLAPPDTDQSLILMHALPRQSILDVYVVRDGVLAERYQTGTARPFDSRPLQFSKFLFPIPVHAHEAVEIFVHARGFPNSALSSLQLWPERKLLTALPGMKAFEFANISVLFTATLVTVVIALFVRQRLFTLFAAFVAIQLVGYVISRGYAFEWFWPNTPILERVATPFIIPTALIINSVFAIAFLDLRRQAPRLYRAAKIGLWGLAAVALAAPIWPIALEPIGVMCIPACYLFLLGISFYLFRHGSNRTDAGVFLLCWGVYLVVIISASLLSWFSLSQWSLERVMDIAQQQRILLLAACLGYRFRQIVRSEEYARADARAKSEFLARMSHEIRTPMNGILGMSELLRDAGLNNTQRRYNDIVYSSATALLTVINDILDFSKIQAGHMTVEKVPFDLHRLCVDALTLFRLKADEKNLELLLDIRPGVPAWVMGDPTRIRQILINFLSNAVKFTDSGEVRLRAVVYGEKIRISIADSGPGIAPDVQARLFESFMQADPSIARHYGGTGLGLAITRQLAELMGGVVGVHSRVGSGSTFWAELPLPATAVPEPPPPAHELHGKSILVVDDNFNFCELVAEHIKNWGMDLHIAHSGAEALARIREFNAGIVPFDLISIDLKMPGMNGVELAHALKVEYGAALPPLLLLTATTDIPQSATRRAAGIVLAQEKPLLANDLREAFARALGLAAPPAPSENFALPLQLPQRALTIFIVEDNPTNQIVIQTMLQKLGHDSLIAENGLAAFNVYQIRHDEFDLILMDCEMPGISGYEATQRIRAFEAAQNLPRKPIVALTAHTLDEHVRQCREAGMDGHLAKPLSLAQLRERLQQFSAV